MTGFNPAKQQQAAAARTRAALLLFATAWLVLAAPISLADSIEMKASADIVGGEVYLRDIAKLTGERAERLGDVVVFSFADKAKSGSVSVVAVRKSLDAAEAHWGLITLRGYETCALRRVAMAKPRVTANASHGDAATRATYDGAVGASGEVNAGANIGQTHTLRQIDTSDAGDVVATDLDAPLRSDSRSNPVHDHIASIKGSLRHELIDRIAKQLDASADDLRVRFSDSDGELLKTRVGLDRWDVEFSSRTMLGRVPIKVRRVRNGRLVESHRLYADVAQRVDALILKRSLSRGAIITDRDIELKDFYLTSSREEPLGARNLAIGKAVTRTLSAGAILDASMIQSPRLIRRGQLIDVDFRVSGLLVRTVGRAQEDGSIGQLIQVRNERSNETFTARVIDKRRAEVAGSTRDRQASRLGQPNRLRDNASAIAKGVNPR